MNLLKFSLTIFLLCAITLEVSSISHHALKFPPPPTNQNKTNNTNTTNTHVKASYNITYIDQPIDHSAGVKGPTWKHKVLSVGNSWTGAQNLGPILFLTGCESTIVDIFNGNGFFNDVVIPQVGAYAIYAEHRYFGDSMPFGNSSYDRKNLPYLTADQALEDFAEVIKYFKTKVLNCPDCPVIAYGGSYCGELASWMRMRHPDLVDGAMASSAPIRYYGSAVDPEAWYAKSTQVYNESATPGSADIIKEGFKRFARDSKSANAYQEMNKYLNFCTPMKSQKDVNTFSDWITVAYQMGSMQNIPQYSGPDVGKKLVDVATKHFQGLSVSSSDQEIYTAMRNSAMVSMRQDPTKCLNIFSYGGSVGFSGWAILTCTDVVVSMGPDFVRDMYPAAQWNPVAKAASCLKDYTLKPKFNWAFDNFGGRSISDYKKYSNIFFVNGGSDPWMVGGVIQNVTESIVSYIVEDGCHVQDMYYPSSYDSASLKFVREKEIEYIKKMDPGKTT